VFQKWPSSDLKFVFSLQPFAKRLAVPDLGDFENKQSKIDPNLGFSLSKHPAAVLQHNAIPEDI